jgi:hypothetical protein
MFAQCNKSIGYSSVYYFFIGFIKNTELGLAMYLNIQLVFLPGESSMTDNAEAGIAAVQAKAAQANGPQQHQKSSIAYLDERISTYLFVIVFMGLLVIWATASSAIIKFGAVGAGILMLLIWGAMRVKRIQKIRELRNLQVREAQSKSSN